jgi:hypothetical protein
MNGCVCPGDTLTYECTVERGVATVWTGSAIDHNNIVLLHSHDRGVYRYCNNGTIVARGHIEGNYSYTSQLNVTITPDTAGKTIECARDNGFNITRFFTSTIPTVTGLSLA